MASQVGLKVPVDNTGEPLKSAHREDSISCGNVRQAASSQFSNLRSEAPKEMGRQVTWKDSDSSDEESDSQKTGDYFKSAAQQLNGNQRSTYNYSKYFW